MTVPSRIRVLPPLLVNKIAAGEVIERPASVVKELLDNAIDAGRSEPLAGPLEVTVAFDKGGTELIRVTDNASGMTPEELELAVAAHATSKLADEDDLYNIATLGFRGEALASIGAVSYLRMLSRRQDAEAGHEVRVSGREFQGSAAAGCAAGTTVEVRDLFYNVPARRKFLKAAATETGHITEVFTRAALAFPEVGLRLINNGKTVHNLPPTSSRVARIASLFGPELSSALLSIERNERGLILHACAAPPAQSRATGSWQYFFVNGRYIRDRFLQHAVKEAYRGLMEPTRFPVVFLYLTIDPRLVDVNVHPTKIEVRWADSNLIHSQVLSSLREALQRADLTPGLRTDRARPPIDPAEQDRLRREFAELLMSKPPLLQAPGEYAGAGPRESQATVGDRGFAAARGEAGFSPPVATGPSQPTLHDAAQMWRSFYDKPDRTPSTDRGRMPVGVPDGSGHAAGSGTMPDPMRDAAEEPARGGIGAAFGLDPQRRAIQLHNMYIVAETDDGLLIIDQHALHERIMYEVLRSRIMSGPLESQRLLLPETIKASPQDLAVIESRRDLLERLGIEADAFGADRIAVHAFPTLLREADVPAFLRDLLDRLARHTEHEQPEALIHAVLDMMACKAAIKAGDPLTPDEIDALVAQKQLVERSSNCPHGRPTTLRLTKSDLERQFKRT